MKKHGNCFVYVGSCRAYRPARVSASNVKRALVILSSRKTANLYHCATPSNSNGELIHAPGHAHWPIINAMCHALAGQAYPQL